MKNKSHHISFGLLKLNNCNFKFYNSSYFQYFQRQVLDYVISYKFHPHCLNDSERNVQNFPIRSYHRINSIMSAYITISMNNSYTLKNVQSSFNNGLENKKIYFFHTMILNPLILIYFYVFNISLFTFCSNIVFIKTCSAVFQEIKTKLPPVLYALERIACSSLIIL